MVVYILVSPPRDDLEIDKKPSISVFNTFELHRREGFLD
jgi:hypothetical protein